MCSFYCRQNRKKIVSQRISVPLILVQIKINIKNDIQNISFGKWTDESLVSCKNGVKTPKIKFLHFDETLQNQTFLSEESSSMRPETFIKKVNL